MLLDELVRGERDHYQMLKRYVRKDGAIIWGRLTVAGMEDSISKGRIAIAMVEDMLRHEIAMREEGDLVFPSQFRRENPDLPNPEGKDVVFRFEGPVMNVYATLVVRLAHSGMFTLTSDDMWRNAAIFGSAAGGRFGLALSGGIEEGWGDLTLFYQNGAEGGLRLQFEDFVYAHLTKRALSESVTRRRFLACLGCGTPVSDIVVTKARELGKKQITCQICDRPISLVKERVAVVAEFSDRMNSGTSSPPSPATSPAWPAATSMSRLTSFN